MPKKSIRDVDLRGKRVLMRVDFNVPLANGVVTDDKRIRAALPSIQHVLDQGAALILMSHLGRPKGNGFEAEFSLKPAADALAKLLGRPVLMAPDCIGDDVEATGAFALQQSAHPRARQRFVVDDRRAHQFHAGAPSPARSGSVRRT